MVSVIKMTRTFLLVALVVFPGLATFADELSGVPGTPLMYNDFAEVSDESLVGAFGGSGAAGLPTAALPVPGEALITQLDEDVPEVVEPSGGDSLFGDDAEGGDEPSAADLFEDDFSEDFAEEEVIPDHPVEDGPIPPVIDRPLGVDEGIKIIVHSFVLDDARDLPEYGIYLDEVQQQLSSYLDAAGAGVTIGRLQEIAEEVTAYYRSRGLILAQVVLPVQDVVAGEVHFQVFEGIMGRVLVEDNKMYTEDNLREPFSRLIGRPVVASEVESALLQLTDFPGLTVFGLFQPGQYVGEADLVLKVQNEERVRAPVRVDNQGTDSTGRNRVRATVDINNPTRSADRLSFSWQEGYSPDNQRYWGVNYNRYLGNGYGLGAVADDNDFRVGGQFADRNIQGATRSLGVSLSKQMWRSRQGNFSLGASLTSKRSQTTQGDRSLSLDRLTVLGLSANYDSVDTVSQALNFATFELAFGFNGFLGSMGSGTEAEALRTSGTAPSRSGAGNVLAAGQFNKAFFTYTRLQTLADHHSLLFRTDLQWTEDLLVPLEQYSVGGPDSVRAYPVAEILWDTAAFGSLEYLIDAPFIADAEAFGNRTWGELLQFSVFYDAAVGKLNNPLPTEQRGSEEYMGFGTGLRLNVPGKLSSRIMVAWPVGDKLPSDREASRVWADLTYTF